MVVKYFNPKEAYMIAKTWLILCTRFFYRVITCVYNICIVTRCNSCYVDWHGENVLDRFNLRLSDDMWLREHKIELITRNDNTTIIYCMHIADKFEYNHDFKEWRKLFCEFCHTKFCIFHRCIHDIWYAYNCMSHCNLSNHK